jgi:DNA-binding beta-propeller fold protein YncE
VWLIGLLVGALLALAPGGALAAPVRPYALARTWDVRRDIAFGIAVNPAAGRVYVATWSIGTTTAGIEEYTLRGRYLGGFANSGAGSLGTLASVAVNPVSGSAYVTDSSSSAINEYSATGVFITQWATPARPGAIAIDAATGEVYAVVGDAIAEYTAAGTLVRTWGSFNASTAHLGQLFGIAVDSATGDVYVTDALHGIDRFTGSGGFIRSWRFAGNQTGAAGGIGVDPASGNVFAVPPNGDIQEFTSAGHYLTRVANTANGFDVAVIPGAADLYETVGTVPGTVNVYVPGRPPHITHQPISRTLSVGATAAFFANASGDPTPAVRWQRSINGGRTWHWIKGATRRTVRVGGVSRALSGDRYRAVFTNGVAPVVTRAAELRVR